jgi:uncharacterized protein
VIALDTNILVYAHREDSPWHERAFEQVRALAEGRAPWAIPWPCIHEFLAVVTHPRIYRPPTPVVFALDAVSAWMESPSVVILSETPDYWEALRVIMENGRVAGPLVHDARVMALCAEHGVTELWSADRDLSRLAGVPVVNPLL